MEQQEPITVPTTSEGIAIHLNYILRNLTELNHKMDNIGNTYVTRTDLQALEKNISDNFVTEIEFSPIKKLVYGCVGLILTAVVIAVVYLVIKK